MDTTNGAFLATLLAAARALDLPEDQEGVFHKAVSHRARLADALFGYAGAGELGSDTVLAVGWQTGGASGGSCWGGEARSFTTDTQQPAFLALDTLLEAVAPTISFLHYKELLRDVENGVHWVNEYYGNGTDYRFQCIPLSTLATRLEGWGYA